jgi:hypothetical protein
MRLHVAPREDADQRPAVDDRQLPRPQRRHELGRVREALLGQDGARPRPHHMPRQAGPSLRGLVIDRAARLHHRVREGKDDLAAPGPYRRLLQLVEHPREPQLVRRREHALRVREERGVLAGHVSAEQSDIGLEQGDRLSVHAPAVGGRPQRADQLPPLVVLGAQCRERRGRPVFGEHREEPLFLLRLVTPVHEAREEVDRARDRRRGDRGAAPHPRRQHLDRTEHLPDQLVLLAQSLAAPHARSHHRRGCSRHASPAECPLAQRSQSCDGGQSDFAAAGTAAWAALPTSWQRPCRLRT